MLLILLTGCTWIGDDELSERLGKEGADDTGPELDTDPDTDDDTAPANDRDGDGYDSLASGGDDCYDAETDAYPASGTVTTVYRPSEINPGATDAWYDGTDSNCDGVDDYDQDGDGVCDTVYADYTTAYGSFMVAIPAGTFTMGGGAADTELSYTDHAVTLTHDFWIGETELTRGAWESWSGGAGWPFTTSYPCTTSTTTADCPADSVTWYDVAQYANALSTAEGLANCYLADGTDLAAVYLADPYACPGYRLPTEAEWEYAARAGEDTRYAGSDTLDAVAWNYYNAYSLGSYAHEVATLAPNAWGLYDMSGNVWEWTNDWYSGSYGGYGSGSASSDPPGPSSGSFRVIRGGYWDSDGSYERVASRDYGNPSYRYYNFGARLSRSSP